ncbi:MAG: divalent metal cation transporter [Acidobacteriota bacterium]
MNLRRMAASLGPGMIVAATAIGTSHIILSPVAGARFGYELIWLVLFSHVFKYPAFEFGPRFAIANGVSLIRGFQDVPGPKNWALWVFLATTTLQGLTILAAVISVTASILVVSLGALPTPPGSPSSAS